MRTLFNDIHNISLGERKTGYHLYSIGDTDIQKREETEKLAVNFNRVYTAHRQGACPDAEKCLSFGTSSPNQYQFAGKTEAQLMAVLTSSPLKVLEEKRPWLYNLLNVQPSNFFCAGGAAMQWLQDMSWGINNHPREPDDYDIFITANTRQEAEAYLISGIAFLKKEFKVTSIVTTKMCTTILCAKNSKLNKHNRIKIQFIRRLYPEDRHDLIIGCFDMWASKAMLSVTYGCQLTIEGLFAISTNAQVLDLRRRSTTSPQRIYKYLYNKQYDMIFLGFPSNLGTVQPNYTFGTPPNEKGRRPDVFLFNSIGLDFKSSSGSAEDYEGEQDKDNDQENEEKDGEEPKPVPTSEVVKNDDQEIDGDTNQVNFFNAKAIARKSPHIMFVFDCYEDWSKPFVVEMSIKQIGRRKLNLDTIENLKPRQMRKLFSDDQNGRDFWRQFSLEACVNLNFARAYEVWCEYADQKTTYLIDIYCSEVIDPVEFWKVDNPGAQNFGQNYQIPMLPQLYYGPQYQTTFIGICHESYFLFKKICWSYGLGKDMFKYLCNTVIKMLAQESMNEIMKVVEVMPIGGDALVGQPILSPGRIGVPFPGFNHMQQIGALALPPFNPQPVPTQAPQYDDDNSDELDSEEE